MNHRIVWKLLVFAILAFTGCGGGSSTLSPSKPGPAPAAPQTWKVTAGASSHNEALQALVFYPAAITIDAGDSVV